MVVKKKNRVMPANPFRPQFFRSHRSSFGAPDSVRVPACEPLFQTVVALTAAVPSSNGYPQHPFNNSSRLVVQQDDNMVLSTSGGGKMVVDMRKEPLEMTDSDSRPRRRSYISDSVVSRQTMYMEMYTMSTTNDECELELEVVNQGARSSANIIKDPTLPAGKDDHLDNSREEIPRNSEKEESSSSSPVKNQSLLVPCIAVYAANYNFTVMAAATFLMKTDPDYAKPLGNSSLSSTLKMLCYAGAVVGQFAMGYVGDYFGRKKGMILTLLLVFFGAFCSAFGSWGDAVTTLGLLSLWRFILGVGNGGVYPLSAVAAAEGTASSKAEDRGPRVSIAYCFNVPGILTPYLLALLIRSITANVEVGWRVLAGFGCIPTICILLHALRLEDSAEYRSSKKTTKLFNALVNREYWMRLVGTGCCWFLYDVFSYGILLVQPEIVHDIWGETDSVNQNLWKSVLLNSIGLPGAIMGILVVKQMGTKWLQFWGFAGLSLSALLMIFTANSSPVVRFVFLAVLNYFINWGAAITTFILPTEVYPPECRSTYNGISAALGKAGAVVGIYVMAELRANAGIIWLMILAAVIGVLGSILTWFFVGPVPKTWGGARSQCLGSLLGCIPFCDPRPKLGWGK